MAYLNLYWIKRILFIVCMFFLMHSLKAEIYPQLDSLEKVASEKNKNNTGQYTTDLIEIYKILNKEYLNFDPVKAIDASRMAIEFAKESKDTLLLAYTNTHFGNAYRNLGYYEIALEHFFNSKNILKSIKDYGAISYSYNDIGNIYYDQNMFTDALKYYNKAYNISLLQSNNRPKAVSLNNIGLVYLNKEQYDNAIQKFLKALHYRKSGGNNALIAHSYNYLGYAYSLKGDKEISLKYFVDAINLYKENFQENELGNVYRFMISLYQDDYEKAFHYYDLAKDIFSKRDNLYNLSILKTEMALMLINIEKYNEAESLLLESIEIAKNKGFLRHICKNYDILKETYVSLGKHDLALDAYKSYVNFKDSIQFNDIHEKYAQMQIRFELKQKDQELAEAEKIKNIQKTELKKTKLFYQILTLLIVVLLVFIGFIMISYTNKVQTNRQLALKKDIIESQKEKILVNNNELKKAKELAEMSSKAKGQFLSNITHEIRTPMSGIIGMTDLIIQSHPNEAFTPELKSIKFSAEKLLSIINEILNYSKLESKEVELESISFDVYELMDELIKSIRANKTNNDIKLILDIDKSTPKYIQGDPTKLYQIILNLVGNAFKFTEKGYVKVKVKAEPISNNEHAFTFIVEDTGIGVEKSKLESIFDSFKQAEPNIHRRFGGTGLGLSIVKNLVNIHKGDIKVESEPGVGSKFIVKINLKISKETTAKINPPKENLDSILNNMTVLLVDDEPINLEVNRRILMNAGANVHTETDGFYAFEKAPEINPGLIILDLEMPRMDGLECTTELRKLEKFAKNHFTIIGLTADIFPETKKKAISAGMDYLLTKPLKIELLKEKLRMIQKKKEAQSKIA
ncbi:MAG: response regulator [Chitinophagaceae bacterium]|nr:MAG: response regulator [Chitinophagaceae bacterium]